MVCSLRVGQVGLQACKMSILEQFLLGADGSGCFYPQHTQKDKGRYLFSADTLQCGSSDVAILETFLGVQAFLQTHISRAVAVHSITCCMPPAFQVTWSMQGHTQWLCNSDNNELLVEVLSFQSPLDISQSVHNTWTLVLCCNKQVTANSVKETGEGAISAEELEIWKPSETTAELRCSY